MFIRFQMNLIYLCIMIILSFFCSEGFNNNWLHSKVQFKDDYMRKSEDRGFWKSHSCRQTVLCGIPKLFRWLVDLYPVVTTSVGDGFGGQVKVDNFYLDMNGIIHSCTHSNDDKLINLNEREMFQKIFAYTDRLYKLVRPTRLMFLAVDGVAPRAKMNQQRARRFRASKERDELLADHVAREGRLPDVETFDSNCITPGTDFLFKLGIAFRRWIAYKMETDPFWKNGAEVVFSGPDVPGEGEHKIMEMIRTEESADPTYKGRYRHCMYGLDADLIMLSLVTHEPFFLLLREKMRRRQKKDVASYDPEDFEVLEISILRQMLKQHFRRLEKQMNSRSAILELEADVGADVDDADDVPEVMEEDTNGSHQAIADSIAAAELSEDGVVGEISTTPGKRTAKNIRTRSQITLPQFELERVIDDFVFMCFFIGNDFLPNIPHLDIADGSLSLMMNVYREMLPTVLGGYLTDKNAIHLGRLELFVQEVGRREPLYFQQRATDEKDSAFGDEGYRQHYYQTKFGINASDTEAVRALVHSYVQGLFWVLEYYHAGCGSWTWFYPQLYAPLATDLRDLASLNITFEKGKPFTPLLQLLSVLPPQSGKFLPPAYNRLMTSPDSPLAKYYPLDFEVDANGKKNSWESIVRIPFLDEGELVGTVCSIDHEKTLTASERMRNVAGSQHRFTPPSGAKKSSPAPSSEAAFYGERPRWGSALDDGFAGGSRGGYPSGGRVGGRQGGGRGGRGGR